MSRVRTLLYAGVAGVVAMAAVVVAYQRLYAGPMSEARTARAAWESRSLGYERDLDEAARVRARLREIGGTTLGRTQEHVSHRFRTLLHELGVGGGLSGVVVTEGRTAALPSPAGQYRLQGLTRSAWRTNDFLVVNGEVRGLGPLESAGRVLALAAAQPWVHRISSFSVQPAGDDREWFDIRVSVATVILADLGPGPEEAARALSPLPPGSEAAWGAIVARNVFRLPSERAVEVADVPPAPPPVEDSGPPYAAWRVSGVIEGGSGTLVVLLNLWSGQSLSVAVGERVLDALLVRAEGECAVFEIERMEFAVCLGQSLADRRRVDASAGR